MIILFFQHGSNLSSSLYIIKEVPIGTNSAKSGFQVFSGFTLKAGKVQFYTSL